MNTKGHHGIAQDAGLPLLEAAFSDRGVSLEAFYLGNWLTDVSQAVDPVAYSAGSSDAKQAIAKSIDVAVASMQGAVDQIVATIYAETKSASVRDWIKSLAPDLKQYSEPAKARLGEAFDSFVKARTDERDSTMAQFFRSVFLVLGYFKFVHSEHAGGQPRMDFEAYMRVFGRPSDTRGAVGTQPATDRPGAYTQYYPHEHVDRPEVLPAQDPKVFDPGREAPEQIVRVARGAPAPGTRSPRRQERLSPDLYSYLRDDIERTAGLLAEVDATFERIAKEGVRQRDPAWDLNLAKLGHALHQVEDFFADSNFVELAVKRLGEPFVAKALPPALGPALLDRARTTVAKRLKCQLTTPLPNWLDHPAETWVVTGFFDFQDTIISLAHVSEEAFGLHVPDPWARGNELFGEATQLVEHPDTLEAKARKLLRDTLDLATHPERALSDRDNDIAKWFEDKYKDDVVRVVRGGVSAATVEQLAKEVPMLRDLPKEIQEAFFFVVVEGSRVRGGVSLYKVIREIVDFITDPIAWLAESLPDELQKVVVDALKFYPRELFYDILGASRIGCHSLLAKDHGLEPFYQMQRDCATGVHWHIVKTMLRWQAAPPAGDKPGYVDWLELLEHFLRNPSPSTETQVEVKRIGVTVLHVAAEGDQLDSDNAARSLAKRYRRTADNPSKFGWRTIADANFGTTNLTVDQTKDVINRTLRDRSWGYPVTTPNYAFRPGITLRIPEQKATLEFAAGAGEDAPWFVPVLEKGWKVFSGFEDPDTHQSVGPLVEHTPLPLSRAEFDQLIVNGKKKRREARDAYRPNQER